MKALAEGRGGRCLSDEYNGSKTKLKWECAYGHGWEAIPNNVKNLGSWCPHCRVNVGEELVRAALEEAFPEKFFNRTRGEPWMEGLELDGYNEELRLAFEYQGKQHTERVEHFQRSEGDFEKQLERDALTEERCQDAFVTLLTISFTIKFIALRAHVRKELINLGYDVAPTTESDSEFYDRVRAQGPSTTRQYEHVVDVIKHKGGECLSQQYVGYRVPLRIRCGNGHVFEATPEAIDQPAYRGTRFCPECGGTRRQEDIELQVKIEACGYEFLGVKSRTTGKRMRRYIAVRCPAGHEYETLWDNFCPKDGVPKKQCAKCHHAVLGRSKRRDISKWCDQHSIQPVGPYTNTTTNCKWGCANGHTFIAKFVVLQNKEEPCSECWLSDFASSNGLRLLTIWSDHCTSSTTLTWQCRTCESTFKASQLASSRKLELCPKCI